MNMTRDERDVWPDDVPIGTFHIEDGAIATYPGATAHMSFVCPSGRRCGILLGPTPVEKSEARQLYVWGWNGDRDRPTLTPSINCRAETSGCGWHGHITNGEIQ